MLTLGATIAVVIIFAIGYTVGQWQERQNSSEKLTKTYARTYPVSVRRKGK